jgi:ribonuclease BN (tRNA processing enzyme)
MRESEENMMRRATKFLVDSRSVSRRDFLKIAGVTGATVGVAVGLGGLMVACGGETETTTTAAAKATTTTAAAATTLASGPPAGPKPGGPPLAPSYKHAQDFSVITVGTGSPDLSETRMSACTMVQYKGKYYTIDTGTGCIHSFRKAAPDSNGATEFAVRDIRGMFFSHLHQDHTTCYFDVATLRWMTGGKDMILGGPPNTGLMHEFLISFWKDDLTYRLLRRVSEQNLTAAAVEAAGAGMFSGVTTKEMSAPESFEYDGMKISVAVMTHTMFDLGYKFEADGKSIVVSGDTAFDADLIELAKGVDLLVLDCDAWTPGPPPQLLDPSKLPPQFQPEGQYGGNFSVSPHMNFDDVVKVLVGAQPKVAVMTHFRPVSKPDPTALLAAATAAGYTGTIELAEDGKEFFPRTA